MYGIQAVMEHIAYSICDEQGDDFSNFFTKNMVDSEKKVYYNNNRKRGKSL